MERIYFSDSTKVVIINKARAKEAPKNGNWSACITYGLANDLRASDVYRISDAVRIDNRGFASITDGYAISINGKGYTDVSSKDYAVLDWNSFLLTMAVSAARGFLDMHYVSGCKVGFREYCPNVSELFSNEPMSHKEEV